MPIRREAFDRGLDDLDERICHFLEQQRDKAYAPEEIATALGVDLSRPLGPLVFELRLSRLVTRGLILSTVTGGGGTYYAARLVKQQKV